MTPGCYCLLHTTQSTPVYSLFIHNMNIQIKNGGKYMVPLIAHPPFFLTSIFVFMCTTFCNFLCITVWHISNKNNRTVVSIHTGFLTYLQNVVYMKKKSRLKKRGDGQSEAPSLSTSTCGRGSEMFALQWVPNDLS